jgi:hypothetical protein
VLQGRLCEDVKSTGFRELSEKYVILSYVWRKQPGNISQKDAIPGTLLPLI